jgi:hypothetical protein
VECAKLTFELPEDREAFKHACNAYKYYDVLRAIAEAFRAHRKYAGEPVTEEMFFGLLRDEDITLD